MSKIIKCDNCGYQIFDDQERTVVKPRVSTVKKMDVFHKDHVGCVDALRRTKLPTKAHH